MFSTVCSITAAISLSSASSAARLVSSLCLGYAAISSWRSAPARSGLHAFPRQNGLALALRDTDASTGPSSCRNLKSSASEGADGRGTPACDVWP